MAEPDEDWLAQQIAYSSGPFQRFRPKSPFDDIDHVSQGDVDSGMIAREATRSNPVKTAAKWLRSWIPFANAPKPGELFVKDVEGTAKPPTEYGGEPTHDTRGATAGEVVT